MTMLMYVIIEFCHTYDHKGQSHKLAQARIKLDAWLTANCEACSYCISIERYAYFGNVFTLVLYFLNKYIRFLPNKHIYSESKYLTELRAYK